MTRRVSRLHALVAAAPLVFTHAIRTRAFALVAVVALAGCGRGSEQARPDSTIVEAPQPPTLRLAAADGSVFDLADQRGKVVAIFFGYTHCPDFCPTTMADFATVKRRLRERGDSVRFVFVSVDPNRDTPAVADRYAKGFDRSFVGLSGDSATLAEVQRNFNVASFIDADSTGHVAENYLVGHSALVFVVGKDGMLAQTVLPGAGRLEWLFNALTTALAPGAPSTD